MVHVSASRECIGMNIYMSPGRSSGGRLAYMHFCNSSLDSGRHYFKAVSAGDCRFSPLVDLLLQCMVEHKHSTPVHA